MKSIKPFFPAILLGAAVILVAATTIEDFFLPGSQIGQSGNMETPDKCDNCHGGYDNAVEPAFNWRGSMMSQSARDPLFYACLAVANQDAPDVGDLCLRCHTPDGWLNGRCEPTDGSALNSGDRQGVTCDFCHKMVKPTPLNVNPFPNDAGYTTTAFGSGTYTEDQLYLSQIQPIPVSSSSAMYIADANNAKRGPFTDAVGRHQMFYSPFHSQADICGTCHDVSNPQFTRNDNSVTDYSYNNENTRTIPDPVLMFPVERTFGEWRSSGYNPGNPETIVDDKTCQDCHMRDVTGKGAKMRDAPLRTNLPLHDMTGGNTFVPELVKQIWASEVNPTALDAGVQRAVGQLKQAAGLELDVVGNTATVKVINNAGHKLPTGYPEGRRIWINLKAYQGGSLIREFGAYDGGTGVLTKADTKIYECEPGNNDGPSFHFAVNNKIWFDNRIPPAGFTNAKLIENQSPVVVDNAEHPGIPTSPYADGQNWDVTVFTLPDGITSVEANLYYQTTSKEYVEFLRDANQTNSKGLELYDLWAKNGKSAPVLMNQAVWTSGTVVNTDPEMLVKSITANMTSSKGFYTGEASVRIFSGLDPVGGAEVTVSYSGSTSGTVTATTDNTGLAVVQSRRAKTSSPAWCFTVTNVAKSGYVYNKPDSDPEACTVKSGFIGEPDNDEVLCADNLNIFPNPVTGNARIDYSVGKDAQVKITIYNTIGQPVAVLADRFMESGTYSSNWDGAGLAEGVYYCRMTVGTESITRTLILIR